MSSPTKTTPAAVSSAGPGSTNLNPNSSSLTSSGLGPTTGPNNNRFNPNNDDRDRDHEKHLNGAPTHGHLPMPGLSGKPNSAVGNLLKGAVDNDGKLKDAALSVGIKLDLEAEVHLTARVRGDIIVGLY